ncbi:hypothetical protein ACFZBU_47630 [Embleya sp. NPDC008237]|uniref:hypothetical protein n=1 Tax=Embleya sp. NPDC008237 TaxID=3363978 RepID=UPI0036E3A925
MAIRHGLATVTHTPATDEEVAALLVLMADDPNVRTVQVIPPTKTAIARAAKLTTLAGKATAAAAKKPIPRVGEFPDSGPTCENAAKPQVAPDSGVSRDSGDPRVFKKTEVVEDEEEAPGARSAGDVRSTPDVGSAHASDSGCAAAGKAQAGTAATVPGPRTGDADAESSYPQIWGYEGGVTGDATPPAGKAAGPKLTRDQAAAVRAVEAVLPAALVALLPHHHIPGRCRPAVLAALESRTVEQLAQRAARRWYGWGYAQAHDAGTLRSAVGVAVQLIGPTPYCADPSCEDGVMPGHIPCRACETRRADRRADRLAGRTVPTGRTGAGRAPLPECHDCGRPFPGTVPQDGVCATCHAEAEAAARAALDTLAEWDRIDADRAAHEQAAEAAEATRAAEEQQQRRAAEAAGEEARRRDAEETARLRAQVALEFAELAAYSVPQDAEAPF